MLLYGLSCFNTLPVSNSFLHAVICDALSFLKGSINVAITADGSKNLWILSSFSFIQLTIVLITGAGFRKS